VHSEHWTHTHEFEALKERDRRVIVLLNYGEDVAILGAVRCDQRSNDR
jgi:hypothetical protein